LNDVFPSFSFHIGTTRGFKDVVASFAMIGDLPMSTKNKRVAKTTNLVLAFKGGLMLLF
jgi:hypothetical protein